MAWILPIGSGAVQALTYSYVEITPAIVSGGADLIAASAGVCSATPTDGAAFGNGATELGWRSGGNVYKSGVSVMTLAGWTSTDVIALGLFRMPVFGTSDTDAGELHMAFIKNGSYLGAISIEDHLTSPVRIGASVTIAGISGAAEYTLTLGVSEES